jgi:hypothetical protein
MTNNWGIRKSFLCEHFNRDTIYRILSRHAEATRSVAVALGASREKLPARFTEVELRESRIKRHSLSAGLSLKHFGALSILLPILRMKNSLAEFRKFDFATPVQGQPWVAWAEPWIRRYEELARACRRG